PHHRQSLSPTFWCSVAAWSVALWFVASASALLRAFWLAEVAPEPLRSAPRIDSGAFALTAFCLAFASASASCFVLPIWMTFCSWPLPPQPDQHSLLPPVWVAVAP